MSWGCTTLPTNNRRTNERVINEDRLYDTCLWFYLWYVGIIRNRLLRSDRRQSRRFVWLSVLGHSWALVGPLMYYLLINFIINKCIVRVRVLKNTHKRSYWFCVFVFLVSPAVVVYLSSIIMMLQYLHLVNTRRNVISSLRRHKNQKKTCSPGFHPCCVHFPYA